VGMSAVNEVVRELGGQFSVRSHDGAGTCWRLTLPVAPERGIPAPRSARWRSDALSDDSDMGA